MKKLFHSLFVVLLALCMLFAMAACDNGSKGEIPGGGALGRSAPDAY